MLKLNLWFNRWSSLEKVPCTLDYLLIILLRILFMWWATLPCCFYNSVSCAFGSDSVWIILLIFIILGVLWASWIFIFVPFIIFGGVFDHYFCNYSLCTFISCLELLQRSCWPLWLYPMGPLGSVHVFFNYFSFFLQHQYTISVVVG